jgi:hypothetical protein
MGCLDTRDKGKTSKQSCTDFFFVLGLRQEYQENVFFLAIAKRIK